MVADLGVSQRAMYISGIEKLQLSYTAYDPKMLPELEILLVLAGIMQQTTP